MEFSCLAAQARRRCSTHRCLHRVPAQTKQEHERARLLLQGEGRTPETPPREGYQGNDSFKANLH